MHLRLAFFLFFAVTCGGAEANPSIPPHPARSSGQHKLLPKPPIKLARNAAPSGSAPSGSAPSGSAKRRKSPTIRTAPPALVSRGDDILSLSPVRYSDLPGWRLDQHADALPAFLASCEKLSKLSDSDSIGSGPFSGQARHWRSACRAAARVPLGNHRKARSFFEKEFRAYAARGKSGPRGRLTGYYVQPLRASRSRHGKYQFPLYRRPDDLVAVSLSKFVNDGRDRRIWGKLDPSGHKLEPYPTRSEFRKTIQGNRRVLLWLDTPGDVVRVEIEGSGKASMDDGSTMMVVFAGKNARRSGMLRSVSRQLRELHRAHPKGPWSSQELARYHEILDQKTSVVFFEMEARSGAIGTQNVVLTPRRSLAVDRAVIALSTPVWVSTKAPRTAGGPHKKFRHLLIAQDTGGAIRGTVRGDIYWGDDAEALAIGRRVNGPGRMWLLLPRELSVPSAPAPLRPL